MLRNIQLLFFALSLCLYSVRANVIPMKTSNSVQFQMKKRYLDYDRLAEPIRGVNIGGWLVLEPYITPSLFEVFRTNTENDNGIPVDEYHYCQMLGYDEARRRLIAHWDSFYTEQDFAAIARQGFNLVRIPVGYWAFKLLDNDPYVTGLQESYLDRAIGWASKYNLKVWIDLHGAAGSQNGFDNSGLRDWLAFLEDRNLKLTLDSLYYILEKYSRNEYLNTVVGIELLNEPLGPAIDMGKYKNDYVMPAYRYLRDTLQRNQIIVLQDAFQPPNYWDNFLTLDQGFWGVAVDHHHYTVFSPGELDRPVDQKIRTACQWGYDVVNEYHWSIGGEFSAALDDCAKWLNGVGVGARYDGTFFRDKNIPSDFRLGSCNGNDNIDTWSNEKRENTRKFVEAQLDAFEMREGWIMWCYKTESAIEWSVQKLIEHGMFPQPIQHRKYPNQCKLN
ncbi:hypothetical protein KAFR_0G02350 [Kazachstania africana CBS 2517]|uniref:glucan 1,3-beta-glucosidase n=1 Tax=Kazachstania africana (strain ATCC 22294 / BCRC 22015 / CBS 2517 / CECT 1963 / NBRC 1671 / NRRL Y-8276) TaxID=1071382 RepID=H2AY19_KAZAF|nr:hypothetical protein KAFR_0G02350 [Kazachstania africana CBS 2517]CCF59269.1 hypothetical protein KAFR_0G02350 [Kazachstania africana CBS 2517]